MASLAQLPLKAFKLTYDTLARTPLRRVPGMLALSNAVLRTIWPGERVIDVQGNRMLIDWSVRDQGLRNTFQAYALNRIHEETTTALFRKFIKPGDTVVDMGANIGYFTMLAARAVGPTGRVISFEPEPTNFRFLSRNIELNGFKNVTAFQKAVSETNGTTELFICNYDSGHHTINQVGGVEALARGRAYEGISVKIDTVRVDDVLKELDVGKVDVVKIDVEGAEALAFKGMPNLLRQDGVKIFAEYFPLLIGKMGSDPRTFLNSLFTDYGLKVYVIEGDYDAAAGRHDLREVATADELAAMVAGESDHVNLLLSHKAPQ
jgi:FkbM family methyltransferase